MLANLASSNAWYNRKPTTKAFIGLFLAAFIIRACVFNYFIQPGGYYDQPDAHDYNFCGIMLRYTGSMTPSKGAPIVWRTPGYAAFMWPFYVWKGVPANDFAANAAAQQATIWGQIVFCSTVPLVLLCLAFLLSGSWLLSWIIGLLSVVHIGFVLNSTFLLTDALSSLVFYLFLIWFYRTWIRAGRYAPPYDDQYRSLIIAGLLLALFTWIRPMGVFVGQCSTLLLLLVPDIKFMDRLRRATVFFGSVFIPLLPWYIRNYRMCGHWFFCPIQGEYLRVFVAPKLIRRATGASYKEAMSMLMKEMAEKMNFFAATHPGVVIIPHLFSASVAMPWVKEYPFAFVMDWIPQVIKTTFDPYSYRLAKIGYGTSQYDPLEEFVTENWVEILYKAPVSIWIRSLGWIEFISMIILWTGFFAGLYQFMVRPLYLYYKDERALSNTSIIWLLVLPMIAFVVVPSGGFGYARLRLPIEPLILILSGIWYLQLIRTNTKN